MSSFFFGSYGVWARIIGSSMDNFFQAWTRGLIIISILIPAAIFTKQLKRVEKKDLKWIILVATAGVFSITPIFYAWNILGIGAATLIYYASITLASYIAGFISFNEKITLVKVVSFILALLGLSLIFNLSIANNSLLAALAAVLAGVAGGTEVAYTKKISGTYSPMQLSIFGWGAVFITHLIVSIIIGERWLALSLSIPWFGVFGFAIASLVAFMLVIVGFKYVEPSIGGIIGLLEIIFGIIFGIIFFHEALTTTMIAGSALIIIAAALPNLRDVIGRSYSEQRHSHE